MKNIVVTGAGGLVGAEACSYYLTRGYKVHGIDNDMRSYFFGEPASTQWQLEQLSKHHNFVSCNIDIRNFEALTSHFRLIDGDIAGVIHCAAQPSHDWAAKEPFTDFDVNAKGTLNIIEALRLISTNIPFVYMSTNKVYGDTPNMLPLVEKKSRWEIQANHTYFERGIDENMSIDKSTHSLFGVSKASADLVVQEYGNYFGMPTACFRGGCLTGGGHSGAELHGFLSYLMKCAITGQPYTVYGYQGKQVRDNIHASDLIRAIDLFLQNPGVACVYNIGGSRFSNCSMLEAISYCEQLTGRSLDWKYSDEARKGDHIWWISDITKFQRDHPSFQFNYSISDIMQDIFEKGSKRWPKYD